jgi:hypothetical protein
VVSVTGHQDVFVVESIVVWCRLALLLLMALRRRR